MHLQDDSSLCQRLDSRQLTQKTSAEGARKSSAKRERERRRREGNRARSASVSAEGARVRRRRKASAASLSPEAQEILRSGIDSILGNWHKKRAPKARGNRARSASASAEGAREIEREARARAPKARESAGGARDSAKRNQTQTN